MSTINKQLQSMVHDYMREHAVKTVDLYQVADWAIRNKRWQPESSAQIKQLKDLLHYALREEYITDPQGRRVRAMHAIVREQNGKQMSLWGDMRFVGREHMQRSFQQRRRYIVSDCRQLKSDVDSYNENWNREASIQISFNFVADLEEEEIIRTAL